jgi:succinate dehydrogenase/fumarate reductase flavoprotein subunit
LPNRLLLASHHRESPTTLSDARRQRFVCIVDGTPVVVFGKGAWERENMRLPRIHEQDVMAATGGQGVAKKRDSVSPFFAF